MEESEARIAGLAREGATPQALVARRMLEEPHLYRHWEAEHDRIDARCRRDARATPGQLRCAVPASVSFIARRMFEYLRVQKVTGREPARRVRADLR